MKQSRRLAAGVAVSAAGLLTFLAHRQYRRDLAAAYQRVATLGKPGDTAAGPIVFGDSGEGAPVLVIHGAGGGFDQALHTAQMFGAGFRWITPSRFGYLGTPLPADASPAAQADAHAALLDALKIEKVPVVGFSAGGPSALYFALRYPQRCLGLVMVSAISEAFMAVSINPTALQLLHRFFPPDWLAWAGIQLTKRKIIPPLGVSAGVMPGLSATDMRWMEQLLACVLPIRLRKAGLLNDFHQLFYLDRIPLEEITAPTLVVHARDDWLVPLHHGRHCQKYIPNARLVEIPQGGHLLLGQQQRVQAAVEPFLRAVVL